MRAVSAWFPLVQWSSLRPCPPAAPELRRENKTAPSFQKITINPGPVFCLVNIINFLKNILKNSY